MKSRARFVKICCVIIFLILCAFLATVFFYSRHFSEKVWKACSVKSHGYKWNSPRGKMVRDLKNRVLRSGMPQDSIITLLGPPDDSLENTNDGIFYYIGGDCDWKPLKLFPRSYYLVLRFDDRGCLKTNEIFIE